MWICIAPCREHTSKVLRYGTRFQGISQFYPHTPRSSANGLNHTCLINLWAFCHTYRICNFTDSLISWMYLSDNDNIVMFENTTLVN